MRKQNLKQAHDELFRRSPDECFESLNDLVQHCHRQKERSTDRWQPPRELVSETDDARLRIAIGTDGASLNDWSFGQLCGLARVRKETINRLSPDTAKILFRETLPGDRWNCPVDSWSGLHAAMEF